MHEDIPFQDELADEGLGTMHLIERMLASYAPGNPIRGRLLDLRIVWSGRRTSWLKPARR